MCVYVYVCVYMCMYVWCVCMCVCMYVCVCMCIYMCMYLCVCMCIHTYDLLSSFFREKVGRGDILFCKKTSFPIINLTT